jgi:hypothetical protein
LNLKFEVTHAVATHSIVITGLDPVIHHASQHAFSKRWMAGSSPAMTNRDCIGVADNRSLRVPAFAGTT